MEVALVGVRNRRPFGRFLDKLIDVLGKVFPHGLAVNAKPTGYLALVQSLACEELDLHKQSKLACSFAEKVVIGKRNFLLGSEQAFFIVLKRGRSCPKVGKQFVHLWGFYLVRLHIESVERLAVVERGFRRLTLMVEPDNHPAISLYRKTGFTFFKETTEFWRGKPRERLCMEKVAENASTS